MDHMSKSQTQQIMSNMDIDDIMASAVSYFQCNIVMDEDTLYLQHSIKDEVYELKCEHGYVLLDSDENPFFALLKRKFRCILVRELE